MYHESQYALYLDYFAHFVLFSFFPSLSIYIITIILLVATEPLPRVP